jgi:hypothetical protein
MDALLPLLAFSGAPSPQAAAASALGRHGSALTVLDGQGGALSLDLSCGELCWLVNACRRLLQGALPRGASAFKVRAAERCFLVSRVACDDVDADGQCEPRLSITDLFDPGASVTLPLELAAVVTSLIETSIARRAHPASSAQ